MDWLQWFNEVLTETRLLSPKERQRATRLKYQRTDKQRIAQKKYRQSEKYKRIKKKYRQSEKGIAANKKYTKTPNGKIAMRKEHAKRRLLGSNELFEIPEGFHSHHINDEVTVPVPARVHERLSGHSRVKHRELVLAWLKKNQPDLWIDCIIHLQGID